jgi:N-dimethylarginine dimethylaminohydrolase
MADRARLLMCPPVHYEIAYVINPWMREQLGNTDASQAMREWEGLRFALSVLADVELMPAEAGLPDLPFTANAGLVLENVFIPSRFRNAERSGEEVHNVRWFETRGIEVRHLPPGLNFEGAGDALFDRAVPRLWMGYGHRSDLAAATAIARLLHVETIPLGLADPRFYHLDTCFCPLSRGHVLYYPAAFDAAARAAIEARVPARRRIAVDEADALSFACNAVNIGDVVVLARASALLRAALENAGYRVVETPLAEFLKAGGSAKCLTLRLDEARVAATSSVERADAAS